MSTITIHASASTHVCDQWAPVCRSSLVFITLMSELSFVQLLHNPALQTVKVTNHPSAVFLDRLASQISLYACFTCPHTRCTHSIFMRVANWHAKLWPETGQESPGTDRRLFEYLFDLRDSTHWNLENLLIQSLAFGNMLPLQDKLITRICSSCAALITPTL